MGGPLATLPQLQAQLPARVLPIRGPPPVPAGAPSHGDNFNLRHSKRQRCQTLSSAAVAAPPVPARSTSERPEGHSALLQGLGAVGDVSPTHMPWLLRLAYLR